MPTAPPKIGKPAALELLAKAGYTVTNESKPAEPGATPTRGTISKDGKQLTLVIGVAANDPAAVAVANTAADQLRNVGIAATVSALDPVVLYGDALTNNRVDAIVGWHRAGGDLATALASRYGCPALEATPVSTVGAPASTPRAPQPSPAPPPPPTTAAPPAPTEGGTLVQAPSNLTGVCDHGIQMNINAALDGSKSIDEVIAAVEPQLWGLAAVLPILQDNTIVAAGPSVRNVELTGPVPIGIVGNAGTWVKAGR